MVDLVFQYRTLIGKCELGMGLDWDEIQQVGAIETQFTLPSYKPRRKRGARRFRREVVSISATVHGARKDDRVELIELGPEGFVIRNAPYIARGEIVELVIDIDDVSYRFSACGVWLKDEVDSDDFRIGLNVIGMPVCVRKTQIREHTGEIVNRQIAA